MPSLGTSFGRGGATDFQQDLQNSDCIVIMGSNMAENHPVGFQWVLEARERGAKVIHVDPRFTRTLGTLLTNGVPLIGALGIVRDAIGNRAGVGAVERATASAAAGAGLSRPLEDSGLFPPRTVHLLRLGEETAQLGPMALRAAEIHEEATRVGVARLIALLVPGITIVLGVAVGGIVASLLLAMLGLNDLAV